MKSQTEQIWDIALSHAERLHKLKTALEKLGITNISFNTLYEIDLLMTKKIKNG